MNKPTPFQQILEVQQDMAGKLGTIATQYEFVQKEITEIHADVKSLLHPETGVYPKITKVRDDTELIIEEIRGEVKTIRTRQGFVVGGVTAAAMLFGQWIVRHFK